jgi:formylglycine-generating enzyme required for sulfatase activity
MRQSLVYVMALSALCVAAYCAPRSLEDYKAVYEKESASIESTYQEKVNLGLSSYGQSLDTIAEQFKKAGDLNGMLALKQERGRFQKESSVPNGVSPDLPQLIQKAQSLHQQSLERVMDFRAEDLKRLTDSYVRRLVSIKKELVFQEKLDEAVAVNLEIKRVEFIVADLESRMPEAGPSPTQSIPPAGKAPLAPKPGQEMSIDLGNGIKMEFVWIPAGSFQMGSPDGETGRKDNEGPAHEVTISSGFWMGKYEVTQEQYGQVTGNNPSQFNGDDNPVERVTWNDAKAFCKTVTTKTGETCRLPTEAEWEYACRAGTSTKYCTGDSQGALFRAGWNRGNSEGKAHAVGGKKPNAWGLYDMQGNVWEWCEDWYGANYYGKSPSTDPQGAAAGLRRVTRGGSWCHPTDYFRVAVRSDCPPTRSYDSLGFRACLSQVSSRP